MYKTFWPKTFYTIKIKSSNNSINLVYAKNLIEIECS